MFPKHFNLSTVFLRLSHRTNACGKTFWEKWWSELIYLSSIHHMKIFMVTHSYDIHEEVALQRFAWYYFTQWELLNNSICSRYGDALPRSYFREGLAPLLLSKQLPGISSCRACLSCRKLPCSGSLLTIAASPSDWAWQKNNGPAILA